MTRPWLIGNAAKTEDALLWYKIAADGGSTDAKAALAQLASHLQIGNEDIDKMVERMQSIYSSTKGRRAGPDKNAATTSASAANTSANKAIVAQIQELMRQQADSRSDPYISGTERHEGYGPSHARPSRQNASGRIIIPNVD
jgi:TPR repeat protein